jgi:acetyl esterase/lipase
MPSTPLGWLDVLVPKDVSSRRIATDLRFGPNPKHKLDLYAPRRPAGPLPLLIFVHGGGWDSGDRREYGFAGRALAALGFLVAIADYRVFPEVVFPAFVEDLGHAATWLQAYARQYGGDPDRLFLVGHSAGAYNAVIFGLQPSRFGGAAVAGRIEAVVGLSGPYDFYPFDVRQSIDAFGTYPEPLTTQPVNIVTSAAPPMLLAHGIKDTTVGDYHTVRLAAKLREAGVPVVERHYPNLMHAPVVLALTTVLRPFLPVYSDVAAFLGGRADGGFNGPDEGPFYPPGDA